jgi:hypothetical protein
MGKLLNYHFDLLNGNNKPDLKKRAKTKREKLNNLFILFRLPVTTHLSTFLITEDFLGKFNNCINKLVRTELDNIEFPKE